ncbi:MAG TPA: hypothetical protein VK774_03670, partial [Solirubrobacteraceae bacterium]|nr:hypothetical protein [Solirubrobacteraceae bacterium]
MPAFRKLLAGICLALLVLLALSAAAAQAAIDHPYTGVSFGPSGIGAGSFSEPQAVTVDQSTGDVFVVDNGEGGRVYKFDAGGEPVDFSSSGTNVIEGIGSGFVAEEEIAVDQSGGPDDGDIYVSNGSVVKIYGKTGTFLGELSGGEMCGVAVDPSGNVYVGIFPETVRRYAPSSSPVTNADENGSMGGLERICNIAVDGESSVYAATWSGGVTKYDALQFGSLSAIGTVLDASARTLAVDPAAGGVFLDQQRDIAQYDGSTEPPTQIGATGASGEGALRESFGVAYDHASDELYASNQGRVEIFGAGVNVVSATTEGASSISASQVTLHGTVEPS